MKKEEAMSKQIEAVDFVNMFFNLPEYMSQDEWPFVREQIYGMAIEHCNEIQTNLYHDLSEIYWSERW